MSTDRAVDRGSRQERKERTRQALVAAALALSADTGLVSVSLRHVARAVGIVPTAFYRHFDSVEELGLVLVDESFESLREMLRDVRRKASLDGVIPRSVDVLATHVRRQPAHFRFIARERNGGSGVVRAAIAHELDLARHELADDLARLPGAETWSRGDLLTVSDLIVTTMVSTAEKLLATDDPDVESGIVGQTRTQLRMLVVGAVNWHSRGAVVPAQRS